MATLRRWQPAPRRQQKSAPSPERILMLCGCAAFAVAMYALMQPSASNMPNRAEEARIASERIKQEAAAKKAEAEARRQAQGRIRIEQREEQARMFNQRYNTDRMPVGSVNAGASEPSPAPSGFTVVKPALPPEQTGGGFREVKMRKPAPPAQ